MSGKKKARRKRYAARLCELGYPWPPPPWNAVLFPLVDGFAAAIGFADRRTPKRFRNGSAAAELVNQGRVFVAHSPIAIRNIFGPVKLEATEVSSDDGPKSYCHARQMAKTRSYDAPDDYKNEVGQRLRRTRIALGVRNLRRFAENTGVDEDNLSNWERGVALVPAWYIQRLKENFGVTHDWIFGGDPAGLRFELAQKLLTIDKREA